MDAIQTIKTAFRRIAPVGNPISLEKQALTHPLFNKNKSRLYQSGTAALAAAILVAKNQKPCEKPEVIIPAYACPDLVSAILYAQCKPILVDIEGNTPYLNLNELKNKLSPQTIAVIAPWFLGIPERFEQIRSLIQPLNIALIEDSAQWFPEQALQQAYSGDLVILSFGKGKPISLLGGGLLYSTQNTANSLFPTPEPAEKTPHRLLLLKYLAFNAVIHPLFYWLLELLPISMGKTVFKPLDKLRGLSDSHQQYLQKNISSYLNRSSQAQQQLSTALKEISLLPHCETYQQQRLLRFPLLINNPQQRDKLLHKMQQQGLGASQFYPDSLPNIEGIPDSVKQQGRFTGAEKFAQRLITLPTHQHSSERQIKAMLNMLTALQK